LVIATLIFDSKSNKLLKPPIIAAPGVLDAEEDAEVIATMAEEIHQYFLKNKKHTTPTEIRKYLHASLRRMIKAEVGKAPEIMTQIEWI